MSTTIDWAHADDLYISVANPYDIDTGAGHTNQHHAITLETADHAYVIEGTVRQLRRLALRTLAHTLGTRDDSNQSHQLVDPLADARSALKNDNNDHAANALLRTCLAALVDGIDPDDTL